MTDILQAISICLLSVAVMFNVATIRNHRRAISYLAKAQQLQIQAIRAHDREMDVDRRG